MALRIGVLLAMLYSVAGVNYQCNADPCTSCAGGLHLYNSTSCVTTCPTGFTSAVGVCTCTAPCTPNIFSVQFYQHLDFTTNTIPGFTSSLVTYFSDQTRLSPIPTKDRGFYFDVTSSIASTASLVVGPDFSLTLVFRVSDCTLVGNCLILSITDPTQFLKIEVNSGQLISTWTLAPSSSGIPSTLAIVTTDFEFDQWQRVIFGSSQADGHVTLSHTYLQTYEYATTFTTINSYEFLNQGSAVFTFGSTTSTSFKGFLYDSIANNYVVTTYSTSLFLIDCKYNEYYLNPQCLPCDASCPLWPWCTHAGVCPATTSGACYSKSCLTCSGYQYSQCLTCSNGNAPGACDCWKFCLTCLSGMASDNTFTCLTCDPRYTLIDGLCIYTPYNWNIVDPAISLTFNTFEQYYDNLFQSGYDGSTYAPYHNPDNDDPYPAVSRGLYFPAYAILKSISKISMSIQNTFLIWAMPEGQGFNFWNSPSMLLFGTGSGSYLLTDSYTWTRFNTYTVSSTSSWTFYSFIHSYSAGVTTITILLNNSPFSTTTVNGYALYDISTIIYIIGEGFLYSLNAYNSAISNPTAEYQNSACGTGGVGTCLMNCEFNQYYDGTSCESCDSGCTSGCVQGGGCSFCASPNCLVCSGFGAGDCTSTSNSTCGVVWVDGTYNNCCNGACESCDGPFDYSCTVCAAGKLVLGSICVSECPDQTYQYGMSCQAGNDPVADFTFDTIYAVYQDTLHGMNLTTGNSTNIYPELLPSDPIPATSRGLYFTLTSYMTSTPVHLSTNFTIIFWIKHKTGGILLKKNTLQITTGSTISVGITGTSKFVSPGYDSSYEWTQTALTVWNGKDSTIYGLISTLEEKTYSYHGSYDFFIDSPSSITLGDASNSFIGFIYRFQVYNTVFDISTLSADTVCTPGISFGCLWDCDIEYYWNGYSCCLCDTNCEFGCKDTGYCNICPDIECHHCHDYVSTCDLCKDHASLHGDCKCNSHYYWALDQESCLPCNSNCVLCNGPTMYDCESCADSNCLDCFDHSTESCTQCEKNYQVVNNVCVMCNNTEYYDVADETCNVCVPPCQSCNSDTNCKSCIANSHITGDGACVCDTGYSLTTYCQRNTFTPLFSISNQNVIQIFFTEPLSSDLQTSDMQVNISTSTISITLTKVDQSTWKIKLNLADPPVNSRVYVNITSILISSLNSLLVDKPYSALLFDVPPDNTVKQVAQTTIIAKNTMASVLGVVVGSSMLMFNPSGFFFFLQALEMYYYVLIYAVQISPELYAFLSILSIPSLVPSPLSYIIPYSIGVQLTGKLNDFGYNCNLFLLNSGISLITIVTTALAFPIFYGLSKVEWRWLMNKMTKTVDSYKYGVFSRLYIQMFLEFLLNSSIGMYYTQMANGVQVFDAIFCGIISVRII